MTQAEPPVAHSISDEVLLAEIARQNPAAFDMLYDRYAPTVLGLIMRILRHQPTAETLLQEIFWQIWQLARQYQGNGGVAAWIYRMARSQTLEQLRRQQVHSSTTEAVIVMPSRCAAFSRMAADRQLEPVWQRQNIQSALAQIPDEQRTCLELAYFEGKTPQQIAEHTNTPLTIVKTHLCLGLHELERLLRATGSA